MPGPSPHLNVGDRVRIIPGSAYDYEGDASNPREVTGTVEDNNRNPWDGSEDRHAIFVRWDNGRSNSYMAEGHLYRFREEPTTMPVEGSPPAPTLAVGDRLIPGNDATASNFLGGNDQRYACTVISVDSTSSPRRAQDPLYVLTSDTGIRVELYQSDMTGDHCQFVPFTPPDLPLDPDEAFRVRVRKDTDTDFYPDVTFAANANLAALISKMTEFPRSISDLVSREHGVVLRDRIMGIRVLGLLKTGQIRPRALTTDAEAQAFVDVVATVCDALVSQTRPLDYVVRGVVGAPTEGTDAPG